MAMIYDDWRCSREGVKAQGVYERGAIRRCRNPGIVEAEDGRRYCYAHVPSRERLKRRVPCRFCGGTGWQGAVDAL